MLTTKLPKRLLWATVASLLMALCLTLPAMAAGPDGPLQLLDRGGPDRWVQLPVAAPRQSFQGGLNVERGQVIDEDVFVYSGDVHVREGGVIRGDVFVFSGDVTVEEGASIEGDLTNYSGDIEIAGTVTGDLASMNGDVELESTARIGGDISVVRGKLERSEGAVVGGNVVRGPNFRFPGTPDREDRVARPGGSFGAGSPTLFNRVFNFFGRIFAAALMTALAMLLVGGLFYVRPQLIADTRQHLREQTALSVVVGALANLVVLFLAGLLAATICLLPLALVPLLLLLAVNVVGWAVTSQIVGERIVAMTKQQVQPALTLLVGAFVLTGICALLWALGGCFQFIASLLVFAVASVGAGAVLVPWINRRRGAGSSTDEGGADNGGDDVPPVTPTPSGPASSYGESAESFASSNVGIYGTEEGSAAAPAASQQEVVEQDVAAPVDYVTAAEINATAAQQEQPAPAKRGRRGRKSDATETTAPDAGQAEAASEEVVEQDVAAPVDYVTAQEINTTEVVSEGDDFLRIKGIGPTYARRLKDAGYSTFAQLAAASPEELASAIGWPVDRVRRSELIDQAKVLAQQ